MLFLGNGRPVHPSEPMPHRLRLHQGQMPRPVRLQSAFPRRGVRRLRQAAVVAVDASFLRFSEGAGCIAQSCVSDRCPRAFPSCNYIAQKRDYLCCDRSLGEFRQTSAITTLIAHILESKVRCPLPNSEPQIDRETGSVVECMLRRKRRPIAKAIDRSIARL